MRHDFALDGQERENIRKTQGRRTRPGEVGSIKHRRTLENEKSDRKANNDPEKRPADALAVVAQGLIENLAAIRQKGSSPVHGVRAALFGKIAARLRAS